MDKALEKSAQVPATATGFDRFIEMALTKQVPVETLERLLAMQKEIMAANAKAAYDAALSDFQKVCPIIHKGTEVRNSAAKGGGLRYRYAAMDSIISQVREPLAAHGFSYDADTEIVNQNGGTWVKAIVTATHVAGHSKTKTFMVPIDKEAFMNEQQKVAAARTYALRYCFTGIFGIMIGDEDDDTNSIEQKKPQEPKAASAPPKTEPAPEKKSMPPTGTQVTLTGEIVNREDLPIKKKKPEDADRFRYKFTLITGEACYTFDKKIVELVDKNINGKATIVGKVTKFGVGYDIETLTFPGMPEPAPLEDYKGELEAKK